MSRKSMKQTNLLQKRRNNILPWSYQIEIARNKNRAIIREEYLTFIHVLYRNQIENGYKRIKDFKDMTMLDIQNEIMLRTRIIAGDNQRELDKQKEAQKRYEQQLLEHFKKFS